MSDEDQKGRDGEHRGEEAKTAAGPEGWSEREIRRGDHQRVLTRTGYTTRTDLVDPAAISGEASARVTTRVASTFVRSPRLLRE